MSSFHTLAQDLAVITSNIASGVLTPAPAGQGYYVGDFTPAGLQASIDAGYIPPTVANLPRTTPTLFQDLIGEIPAAISWAVSGGTAPLVQGALKAVTPEKPVAPLKLIRPARATVPLTSNAVRAPSWMTSAPYFQISRSVTSSLAATLSRLSSISRRRF